MKLKTAIFLVLIMFFILASFNYGPMLYRRFTGNGGAWVEFYHYKISQKKLLTAILSFKKNNKQLWPPKETSISYNQGIYVYVKFYENNKYYHTWICNDTSATNATLIFGGVSETPRYDDAQLINRDMGFLKRQKTLQRFTEIILNKLF